MGPQVAALLQQPLDWDYLLQAAAQHGVLPLLYWNLNAMGSETVPRAYWELLRLRCQTTAARNLLLTQELLALLARLEEQGISALPLKGPALAVSAYDHLALRTFGDLDVLVRERDVARARSVLITNGYHPVPDQAYSWEAAFVRDGTLVDLHWGITPNDTRGWGASFAFDLEAVWERLGTVSLAGKSLPYLAPEDALLVRCQNSVKDYFQEGWPRLQWICDVAWIIHSHPELNWIGVIDRASKLGSRRALFLGLSLASKLLGASLPHQVHRRLQRDRSALRLSRTVGGWLLDDESHHRRFKRALDRHLFCIQLKERIRDKLPHMICIFRILVAPNEQDRSWIRLPGALAWMYYLTRPFRLAGKYIWLARVRRVPPGLMRLLWRP